MIVDSTAYRRVDGAQRNPPNAAGITQGSSAWWIPAPKAPASIDGRPRFVKRSLDDGEKVKIAAIDPDFV